MPEGADRLSRDARHPSLSTLCQPVPDRPYRNFSNLFVAVLYPKAPPSSTPGVFKGFVLESNCTATSSTYPLSADQVLAARGCAVIPIPGRPANYQNGCPFFLKLARITMVHRAVLIALFAGVGMSVCNASDYVFPTGDILRHRRMQGALLVFLNDCGLADEI